MQVKVGDTVYNSEDQPIMVILTDDDKRNIANMHPECTKYATFQDNWGSTDEMSAWMDSDLSGTRAMNRKGIPPMPRPDAPPRSPANQPPKLGVVERARASKGYLCNIFYCNDLVNEIDRLTAALEQCQSRENRLFDGREEQMAKQDERIEALEAALRNIHSLPARDYCDTLAGFAGAVRAIAFEALEYARNSGHVHDWSDVDAFGWRRCRDTDCGAGLPPSVEDT